MPPKLKVTHPLGAVSKVYANYKDIPPNWCPTKIRGMGNVLQRTSRNTGIYRHTGPLHACTCDYLFTWSCLSWLHITCLTKMDLTDF